jgi:hypothetical protein
MSYQQQEQWREEQWVEDLQQRLAVEYGSEWREHPQALGYFVSRDGRVARFNRDSFRLLIGCSCGRGYRAITWKRGDKLTRFYIHRAVCELFNGPCPPGMECRHLNGCMTDNRAENLAWGTAAENGQDRYVHGTVLFGERNPMARLTQEQVDAMRAMRRQHNTPYYQLGSLFNVSTMTALRAVKEISWKP